MCGSVCLDFSVNGLFLSAQMLVSDEIDEMILGFSWMCENRCVWQFHNAVMLIRGVPVRLISKSSNYAKIRCVYVRENVSVPADYRVNVPVRLPAVFRNVVPGDFVAEPKEIRPGLLMSRTFMSGDSDFAAVQVLNLSGKDHILPAGLRLGNAEIGECLGPLMENVSNTTQVDCQC